MPARTLPNLSLLAGYDLGEDGWADDMTLNLLKLSVLTQGTVQEKVAAEPVSPTAGDVILLDETNATNPNAVAVYDGPTGEEAWVYIAPNDGWLLYNQAAGYYEKFDGTVWAELETGGGGGGAATPVVTEVSDAGSNLLALQAGLYLRFTATAAKALTVRPDATEPLPANGEWHIRNVGAGDLTLVEGSGVTINPPNEGTLIVPVGGTVTLKLVAADEFDLLGQTAAA